jgi:hypothetical protein
MLVLLSPLTLAVPGLLPSRQPPVRAMLTEHAIVAEDGPASASRLAAARPLLGFAINAHHISDLPLYLESVDRIADLGANALVVVTPWFQRHADSSTVRRLPRKCPTDRQLMAILARARDHGMYTVLQPIVLIESPREKDWRGVIRPERWDDWWADYDRFIDYHVNIALEVGIDQLCIGSELNTTEDQLDRWRQVASRVRARFGGLLSYSANWDRYEKIEIWPLVDVMSVSSYFEIGRDDPDASAAELARTWAPVREDLIEFARRWDRPLVLSEVGYPSLPWAARHPWNYVAKSGAKADHEAQARCYQAFFEAWSETVARGRSPVAGFFCYRWDPYHRGQSTDTGYGVRGKPAAGVIRAGFERIRSRAAAPDKP